MHFFTTAILLFVYVLNYLHITKESLASERLCAKKFENHQKNMFVSFPRNQKTRGLRINIFFVISFILQVNVAFDMVNSDDNISYKARFDDGSGKNSSEFINTKSPIVATELMPGQTYTVSVVAFVGEVTGKSSSDQVITLGEFYGIVVHHVCLFVCVPLLFLEMEVRHEFMPST